MQDSVSSKYRTTPSFASHLGKQKNFNSFKDRIREEVKKRGKLLSNEHISQYSKLNLHTKKLVSYCVFSLLEDDFKIQTIKENFEIFEKNAGSTQHSLKMKNRPGKMSIYYLYPEHIKSLKGDLETYIKYSNKDHSATYSKVEDEPSDLYNVENAVYYLYHYLIKALNLQKEGKKKELEENEENTPFSQRKTTNHYLDAEKRLSFGSMVDLNGLPPMEVTYNSCRQHNNQEQKDTKKFNGQFDDVKLSTLTNNLENKFGKEPEQEELNSVKESSNQIVLLEDQVAQLTTKKAILTVENTQLKNNLSNTEQRLEALESKSVQEYQSKLEREIAELQKQLESTRAQLPLEKRELEKEKLNWQAQQCSLIDGTDEVAQLRKDLEEANSLNDNFGKKCKGLEQDNSRLQMENEQLHDQMQKLSRQKRQLENKQDKLVDETYQATQVTQENSKLKDEYRNIKADFEKSQKELDDAERNVLQLKEQMDITKQDSVTKIEELESTNKKLVDTNQKISQLEQNFDSTKQELFEKANQITQLQERLKDIEVQFAKQKEKNGELNNQLENQNQQLDKTAKELESTQTELEKLQKDLAKKNSEITQLVEELERTKVQLAKKGEKLGDAKKNIIQLEGSLKQANQKIDDLTRENNQLTKEKGLGLNNENKKLSTVNTQSRKQGNYASVSFILFGVFAVGASLTIPYLAICITLAVAASASLAVGLYCSYKANTALNNVKVDQVSKNADCLVA